MPERYVLAEFDRTKHPEIASPENEGPVCFFFGNADEDEVEVEKVLGVWDSAEEVASALYDVAETEGGPDLVVLPERRVKVAE